MQAIATVGLDIAKSVFQVHGVDARGSVVVRRQLKRRYVLAFFKKLSPCLVGVEACATSHHWSRELQRIIEASPTGDLAYLVTDFGKPFSIAGFGNKMRQWCNEAGLPHCSAHGLRKGGATRAAENGATDHQLMTIFGWKSIQEAERYTKAARRKKMAGDAMPLLRRTKGE